jgi:hypothetical protein
VVPLHAIDAVDANPVPMAANMNADPPAATCDGEMEVKASGPSGVTVNEAAVETGPFAAALLTVTG